MLPRFVAGWLVVLILAPFTAPFPTCDLATLFGRGPARQTPIVPSASTAVSTRRRRRERAGRFSCWPYPRVVRVSSVTSLARDRLVVSDLVAIRWRRCATSGKTPPSPQCSACRPLPRFTQKLTTACECRCAHPAHVCSSPVASSTHRARWRPDHLEPAAPLPCSGSGCPCRHRCGESRRSTRRPSTSCSGVSRAEIGEIVHVHTTYPQCTSSFLAQRGNVDLLRKTLPLRQGANLTVAAVRIAATASPQ